MDYVTRATIFKIAIESINADTLARRGEIHVRVAADTQDAAEVIAARMLSAWLRANPERAATYVLGWANRHDLGERD